MNNYRITLKSKLQAFSTLYKFSVNLNQKINEKLKNKQKVKENNNSIEG